MPLATYTRQTYPIAAARLLAQREMARRGLTWQRSAEDEALWQVCRWDYAKFGKTFLAAWCPDEFNQLHLDYYERLRERQGSRGHFDAVAASRGHSKTTGCCLVSILHDCAYQTEAYTLYLTNRHEDAVNRVRDCRDELENNEALIRVYGPQVSAQWNNADFTTAYGQRVRAASRHTQLRGAISKGRRPTRIILDDIEHAERVLNEEQRQNDWNWLTKEILHLGQPLTNYEIWGTILHDQAMLKRALVTPGWTARLYQAVQQFADPASIPLWQEWRALFLDLSNQARQTHARAFFEAHKDVMLQGSRVLWPSRRPYIDLMESRLREGESSFFQELQNQPLGDERYVFDMEAAAFCMVTPAGITRAGGTLVPWSEITELAMAYDPVPDKKDIRGSDYASVPVVAQDKDGYLYVVDAWVAQETSTDRQIAQIVRLLWQWDVKLLGVESNGFSSLLPANIREAIKQRALTEQTPEFQATIVPIVNLRSKVLRILTLESLVLNHWLQFSRTLPPEAFRQMREFLPIPDAGKDDFPDSVEMAIRTIRHQWEKRDIS